MESSRHNVYATSSNNYRKDMRYVFKPNSLILSSIGIWPLAIRQASKIMIVIYNLVLSFAIVPCVLHIIYDVKDVNVKMKLYGLLGFCITVMMKYCVLTLHQPGIRRCIEHVKSDWWQVGVASGRRVQAGHEKIWNGVDPRLQSISILRDRAREC
jgi:hypothetical protein